MTLDPTKPVQTRDGRKARIIATDRNGSYYPIIALVSSKNSKEEIIVSYRPNGSEVDGLSLRPLDLINVPEERELWVNVYNNTYSTTHPDQEQADRSTSLHGYTRIARLRIRFTVGQMDE